MEACEGNVIGAVLLGTQSPTFSRLFLPDDAAPNQNGSTSGEQLGGRVGRVCAVAFAGVGNINIEASRKVDSTLDAASF